MKLSEHIGNPNDLERFPELAPQKKPNFEKRAASRNKKAIAKAVDSAGPLFAEQAIAETPTVTAAEEAERWRKSQVSRADMSAHYSPIMRCIEWLSVIAIEAFARRVIADDAVFERLKVYIRNTYPMPDYGVSVWSDILCRGRRVVYGYIRHVGDSGKIRLEEDGVFQLDTPAMAHDEFLRRYSITMRPSIEPDPTCVEHERLHAEFIELLLCKKKTANRA